MYFVVLPAQMRESERETEVTLKYMGSTLCLMAWAFPTRASTDDTFSGSWRFSTTVLMAFITLRAWCRSWLLRSISSGSSMSWNWLKYCLADGKLMKNLRRQRQVRSVQRRKALLCFLFSEVFSKVNLYSYTFDSKFKAWIQWYIGHWLFLFFPIYCMV